MDGMRLTDAQKHRLASQNEDCHSKKTFLGASSGTARAAKKNCFVRTQEFIFGHFFVRFLGFSNRGHHLGGPLVNCLV
jgi:hypothetical protein